MHGSVFGSFAWAEGSPGSAIDLLLVIDSGFVAGPEWEQQLRRFEDDVYAWTGNRLRNHHRDKDFWDRVVVITSKD